MLTARHILDRKNAFKAAEVATAAPDETVLAAAQRMNERRIGSLVVRNAAGEVEGIITERDLLTRVIAAERSPSATRVRDVMTTDVITCAADTAMNDLRDVMHERRIRHVPIVDGTELAGLVSIGDVNAAESESLIQTISHLEAYITSG